MGRQTAVEVPPFPAPRPRPVTRVMSGEFQLDEKAMARAALRLLGSDVRAVARLTLTESDASDEQRTMADECAERFDALLPYLDAL